MSMDMAIVIFIGLVILAGAIVYFGLGVNRTADSVEEITNSPVGSFLLGLGS